MTFISNSAVKDGEGSMGKGGAISVNAPSVGITVDPLQLFNTRCFFQYELENTLAQTDPADWNVSSLYIIIIASHS